MFWYTIENNASIQATIKLINLLFMLTEIQLLIYPASWSN